MRGNRLGGIAHRADRYAQDHQIRLAHRFGHAVADHARKAALGGAGAHIGIGIPASGRDIGQHFAHRQPDRTADQPETDDGDA